ncbi:MAG: 4Fe-4S binding protein [Clostridia bacterium]|nr:4Fe-4S binding protein [Clostridia bacterium]
MNHYIVTFSPTKTTLKVVEAIAKGMTEQYKLINITSLDQRKEPLKFEKNDVVIIGAPVYAGRLPVFVADFYKQFEGNGALAVPVVVYGNRHYDDALLELYNILKDTGFSIIGAGIFVGEHSYSKDLASMRPDASDLAIAYNFGKNISYIEKSLDIPGDQPYRAIVESLPIGPDTSDACVKCGVCYNVCPMDAINNENFLADENKCIKCHACVKSCPMEAKAFDHRLDPIRERLKTLCADRKEPILF